MPHKALFLSAAFAVLGDNDGASIIQAVKYSGVLGNFPATYTLRQ